MHSVLQNPKKCNFEEWGWHCLLQKIKSMTFEIFSNGAASPKEPTYILSEEKV